MSDPQRIVLTLTTDEVLALHEDKRTNNQKNAQSTARLALALYHDVSTCKKANGGGKLIYQSADGTKEQVLRIL